MGLVRELHGGRDYDPQWGRRMKGEGVVAALIARRFETALGRLGCTRPAAAARPTGSACRGGAEQLALF